jgi:hypothetical protein
MELHCAVRDATPCHTDAKRDIKNQDKELSILIRVQLTDGGRLKRYTDDNTGEQPEQLCCAMLPCVVQTKRELEIDNEFEEDEVGIGH